MLRGAGRSALAPVAGTRRRALRGASRAYHSFPDPKEKPVVTRTRSSHPKPVKTDDEATLSLKQRFAMGSVLPGIPTPSPSSTAAMPEMQTSELPNGMVVASQECYGMLSSVGLIVGAGSADADVEGVVHLTEITASMGVLRGTAVAELRDEVERLGATLQVLTARDSILYFVDVLRASVPEAVGLLAEAALHPALQPHELEEAAQVVEFQRENQAAEVLSRDLVLQAAFRGQPLGVRHFATPEGARAVDRQALLAFRERFFRGPNMVLTAADMDHPTLMAAAQKHFGAVPPAPGGRHQRPRSRYTGGLITEERTLQEPFVRVAVAFEACGWHDEKMLLTMCVLQMLLGGGSSFSAGGPGKGMYSRLYRGVLNRHHWIEAAEGFLSLFDDTGVLGIDGACRPETVEHMIRIFIEQLAVLTNAPTTDEELHRARNMVKSSVLMQLESRLVLCEDMARQLQTYGRRQDAVDVCNKLDSITQEDIMAAARHLLSSPPSIAAVGADVSKVPTYDHVLSWFRR